MVYCILKEKIKTNFSNEEYQMRKELNISASTYEQIIKNNYMYVDKTDYLYKMVRQPSGQYFLSRPRRFGKSMTLSTLRAVFEGKKELFKNTFIYTQSFDWKLYPIISLSLNEIESDTVENFKRNLSEYIDEIAEDFDLEIGGNGGAGKFKQLIRELYKRDGQVVVLIDEYDKPILDNLSEKERCNGIRDILKPFYEQIKAQESKIRFAFVTGVSKFTQMSFFSGANNLDDISMNENFASICGFTQEECEKYFAEWIIENSKTLDMTKSAYLTKLKNMYNGIRFCENSLSLYNPVSITNAMKNCNFKNYWVQTGNPSFLLKEIKKDSLLKMEEREIEDFEELENIKVSSDVFSKFDLDNLGLIALLYQSGYLTIKSYIQETDRYILSYPNKEVKESFINNLAEIYSKTAKSKVSRIFEKLFDALEENNMEDFIEALKVYYANIDYDIKNKDEKCYQLIFYLIFTNLNFRVTTEVKTNKGRMDAVIETQKYIYIFEFKVDQSADIAINQIKEKEYYQKYLLDEKELILVGVNFDSSEGQVDEWKSEINK